MEPIIRNIKDPKICKDHGVESLFNISRELLCNNTSNFTAYRKSDGADAKSLSATADGYPSRLLRITYDAETKFANVSIDWSHFTLNSASTILKIRIRGNHDVNIDVSVQILYPLKTPIIEMESKTGTAVWGTENICNLVIKGKEDGGHESWRYQYQTKVFIAKIDGFYVDGYPIKSHAGVDGYMIPLNQWERKSISIKYKFGNFPINQPVEKKLPVIYIYTSNTDPKSIRRETPDVFKVKFTPLKPEILLKTRRLQEVYILGSRDVSLFEVIISKKNIYSEQLTGLRLTSADSRIIVSKLEDTKYIVSLNASSFKELPDSNVQVDICASANNANAVSEHLILTTGQLNNDKSVLLKKKVLLKVDENSDIKNNGRPIVQYKDNPASQYSLNLRNISSTVLGTGLELRNLKLEIRSNLGISFVNGRIRENISSLQDGVSTQLKININPDAERSVKEFNIVITSDYSNPLVINAKVETKDKIGPQIYFDFCQTSELHCVESDVFKPLSYANHKIGTLSIRTEEIPEEKVNNYAHYDLQEFPIEIPNNEKITFDLSQLRPILQPNERLELDVLLNGEVSKTEYFVVKSGLSEKDIPLSVSVIKYNLPDINFNPTNDDLVYEYSSKERLYLGELEPKFQDSSNFEDVNCIISVSKPLCFEDGSCEVAITKISSPIKLYLLLGEEFHGVTNICKEKSFPFNLSLSSSVFCEKKEAYYGDIVIAPIVAEASPYIELRFEQKPDEGNHVVVYYSDIWFSDSKNQICELILRNNTTLPYSPNEDCENDFVEFSDIRIEDEDGFILFDNPGTKTIDNGEQEVIIPVYIDCKKWQGQKKEIKISCDINVGTSNKHAEPSGDDYYVEFVEQRNDKIFSLDLGTTGIVMAKQEDFEISTIELQDEGNARNQHIEESDDIISSITIINEEALKDTDDKCHQILISPRRRDYKNKSGFIFVPAKFMVGQKRIPYISKCLHEIPLVAFDPILTTWDDQICDENYYTLDANEDGYYLTPELFLQLTYENILNRCYERENIRKLILTYPNTYTNNVLEELRSLVSTKIDGLSGFVDMVPESDAVVAYYFNERINYFGDDARIAAERKINVGKERVLIYDMGAGTLDLSLVTIARNPNSNRVSADIEKKIGIPIAGNYLDWVLFELYFKDKLKDDTDKTLKNLKDYIKQIKQLYTTKGKKEKLPQDGANECLEQVYVKDLMSQTLSDNSITYDKIDDSIEEYIKVCSETILSVFLGDNNKVDRLVYSGRGSQFGPLRAAVQEFLKSENPNLIIDRTIENSDLKTCVAKGAICYNDLFGADSDHVITNRNQHLNLGVVYIAPSQDGSSNEIHYKEIIHPDDGRWADEADLIDGTWWRNFDNTVNIDLSVKNKKVYFIQTLLDAEKIKMLYRKVYSNPNAKRTELEWVFVNELFSFNTNTLTQHNREEVAVNVIIDMENNINYSVGGRFPKGEKLVDRIENNIFYQHGMWPYINFDN